MDGTVVAFYHAQQCNDNFRSIGAAALTKPRGDSDDDRTAARGQTTRATKTKNTIHPKTTPPQRSASHRRPNRSARGSTASTNQAPKLLQTINRNTNAPDQGTSPHTTSRTSTPYYRISDPGLPWQQDTVESTARTGTRAGGDTKIHRRVLRGQGWAETDDVGNNNHIKPTFGSPLRDA